MEALETGETNSWPSPESKLNRQINVARRPSLAAQQQARQISRLFFMAIIGRDGTDLRSIFGPVDTLRKWPRSRAHQAHNADKGTAQRLSANESV